MSSNGESDMESANFEKFLPVKSKEKYLNTYDIFMRWKNKNNEDSLSESVFIKYFTQLSLSMKSSSLWAIYSMLKCTMRLKHKVLMQNYTNLSKFIKSKDDGIKCVSSRILTQENIQKFINEAPDEKFLVSKVILIIGVSGGCRLVELSNITTKSITTHGDVLLVVIRDSLHKTERMFVIQDEHAAIVKKYIALRPTDIPTDRFFVAVRDGKCIKQVIGKNKIATIPKEIATYLKLPNPERYTGHCFRKSATLSGLNLTNVVKRRRTQWDKVTGELSAQQVIDLVNRDKSNEPEAIDDDSNQDEEYKEIDIDFDPLSNDTNTQSFHNLLDFQSSQMSPGLQFHPESDKDINNMMGDTIHIKTEEVDETIPFRPKVPRTEPQPSTSKDKLYVQSDEHQTHINVAGKNITLSFNNCTNVGNVVINILNK